ncbi:50S ribosomal protein L17 [Candidatus Peregrinibacteria bacterium]|nr:50S ribosomal protein L17 [Candidatus Peregrinibacteria bacterium]
MRHNVKKTSLNLPAGQRKLQLMNLATDLMLHEKIKTTETRAKAIKPIIDRLINKAKNPNKVIAIREVSSFITQKKASKKLIDDIAKRYDNRNSGYTKMTKLGFRNGDAASLVQIELTK